MDLATILILGFGLLCTAIVIGLGVFVWLRRRSFPTIMDADGRRAWAFMAITGGCIVFTGFAAVGVYLVSANQLYSLILALAAHVQILVGLSAMGFLLGRRMQVSGGRDGFMVSDAGEDTALGAKIVAGAAVGAADAIEGHKHDRTSSRSPAPSQGADCPEPGPDGGPGMPPPGA